MVEQQPPIIAIFDDRGKAQGAIDDLWHAGFRHDQIGILTPGQGVRVAETITGKEEKDAATGTAVGAVAGGTLGALVGAVAVGAIPGIGPILAGGILTGVVTGAAAGAALGAFLGPFVAMGMSEEDARRYAGELRAGRTIIVVHPEDREDEAILRLREHGGVCRQIIPAETAHR
jgi:hypothetical protein